MSIAENDKRELLIHELLEYFEKEGFRILSAKNEIGYQLPSAVPNDGYGDQQNKTPDILAYNDEKKNFVLGIVKMQDDNLESEESLTEYNVFLDQKDDITGEPHRLYIMLPSSRVHEMTALLTHYIHREYWHKVVIVASHQI